MVDQKIIDFISKVGIGPEGAKIYLALIGKPSQTAQEISKNTGIPKTTIYRRLEELKKIGLVEEHIEEFKKTYHAAPLTALNLLVVQKEQELQNLKAQLPEISQLLAAAPNTDPETKVLFFRGTDGIQQMAWNTLSTKDELCGYSYRSFDEIVGKTFAKKFQEEFELSGISARDLYSQGMVQSRKEQRRSPNEPWQNWQSRYISPKTLDIRHQMDIYNDVVAIYNWHDGEVFGVEIHNHKVTAMQKQIFEVLWKLGKTSA